MLLDEIKKLWPELVWIKDESLRDSTLNTWAFAIKNSVFSPTDLEKIPFTTDMEECKISFMQYSRTSLRIAIEITNKLKDSFGNSLKINMDYVIAGAILFYVGKLNELDIVNGQIVKSNTGKLLNKNFSGVAFAHRFSLPSELLHIIADDPDINRINESIIVSHAYNLSLEVIKNNYGNE